MKVFLSVASLKPSYGGPAHSVSQLAGALAAQGVDVGVWAADGSAQESKLLGPGIRRLVGAADEGLASFGKPDVIHDNGIWLPHNHRIAVLAGRSAIPRVVSLRGMLEPWARRHKVWKKTAAWFAYQRRDLVSAAALHATSQAEADNIAAIGLSRPIEVVGNGIPLPKNLGQKRRDGADRTALFLGRIYPVKGLPMLVEAWAQARPAGWRLCIAGPDEAGHKSAVEAVVRRHGLVDVVEFPGAVAADDKAQLFADADLFVLSSYSESFGMAVGEAMAHGRPVLATKAAPWPQLVSDRCGWWVEPTVAGLAHGLGLATAQSPDALAEMGARGRNLIAQDFSWESAARDLLALYARVKAGPL